MLKKPYKKLMSLENNNYYYIKVGNYSYYLAIESVSYYFKRKKRHIQQGLKLLPINSPILLALVKFAQLKIIDVKKIKNLGKENIYEILDVNKLRKEIKDMTKKVHDESNFDFKKEIHSATVKDLIKNAGYEFLMIENYDSWRRSYWLIKSDKYGKLTIQEVVVFGKKTEEKYRENLQIVNTFILNQEIVGKLLIEINNKGE